MSRRVSAAQSDDRVLGVQERLRQEVRHTAVRQERLREALAAETPSCEGPPAILSPTASTRDVATTDLDYLKRAWQKVKASHTQEIIDVIRNGAALVGDELEIKHGLPSLEALSVPLSKVLPPADIRQVSGPIAKSLALVSAQASEWHAPLR